MSTPLEQLNAKIFREHLRTPFKVRTTPTEEILLELVAVEEQNRPGMELFSLQFVGPFLPRLQQQTVRLQHEKLGNFEIFLTPLSADSKQGTVYESIFHRFRDRPS
jgi:hypothetical protein